MTDTAESASSAHDLGSEAAVVQAVGLKEQGNQCYKDKKYADACKFYSQAIELDPKAEYYGNRALSYLFLKQYDKAASDCDSALRIDPRYKKGYLRATRAHLCLGQLEEAKQYCSDGMTLFPRDKILKDLNYNLLRVQSSVNHVSESVINLEQRYQIPAFGGSSELPSDSTVSLSGEDSETIDDEKTTGSSSSDSTSKSCSSKRTAAVWVTTDTEKAKMDRSLSIVQRILEVDCPASLPLRALEIRIELAKQDYVRALSLATTNMRSHKTHRAFVLLRGIALFKTENNDSAKKHFQQVLRADPDCSEARTWFKLVKEVMRLKDAGNTAYKAGKLDDAFSNWDNCIRSDPTNHNLNAKVLCNIVAIWLKRKEWQRAYDDSSASLSLDGNYAKAYVRRSQALVQLERWSEAVSDAERATELDSTDKSFRENLKYCKLELKKSKRKDYYKMLGVSKDVDERSLEKAYKKMAMKWHPDRFGGASDEERKNAENKFKEISEAYEVLKDPKTRRQYDAGKDLDEIKQSAHNPFASGGGVDISQLFNMMGGMGGGGRTRGHPGGFTFRFG